MRKVSKLLTFILAPSLLVGLSAVLGGCGPAAMPVAEPTSTAVSHLTGNPGENHFSIPGAAVTPGPSPTPFGRSDPPVELVPGAQESIRPVTDGLPSADPGSGSAAMVLRKSKKTYAGSTAVESGSAGVSEQVGPDQGQPYTWHDGDRTMTVLLQDDLTVTQDGDIASKEDIAARTTRSDTIDKAASAGLPVFRSQSGSLMTLPGGVLLALDETWGRTETDAFFSDNGIDAARVSELDYVTNGFFVETEHGFPSLELANALASQDGVEVSSPNWRREVIAK